MSTSVVLRFGTVLSVTGRQAQVRFPGSPNPHPVFCVESPPAAGQKIAVWSTFDRLYYTGGGAPTAGGVFDGTTDGDGKVTIPLPTSPTGRWALIPVAIATAGGLQVLPLAVRQMTVTATSASLMLHSLIDPVGTLANNTVTIHWHAVAY